MTLEKLQQEVSALRAEIEASRNSGAQNKRAAFRGKLRAMLESRERAGDEIWIILLDADRGPSIDPNARNTVGHAMTANAAVAASMLSAGTHLFATEQEIAAARDAAEKQAKARAEDDFKREKKMIVINRPDLVEMGQPAKRSTRKAKPGEEPNNGGSEE